MKNRYFSVTWHEAWRSDLLWYIDVKRKIGVRMENAVIYARYSSHSQTEATIEKQIEECRKYAEAREFKIVGEYVDRAKTGTNFDRVEFQRMMHDAKNKKFVAVIVFAVNRFGRDSLQSKLYIKELSKMGITVHSTTESFVKSEEPTEKLMTNIIMSIDEFYSDELSAKITYGMKQAAEKGFAVGGQQILGYKVVNRRFEVDEKTSLIVKEIFDMFVYQRKSRAEIIRYFDENGVLTPQRKKFKDNIVKRVLMNEKYIGRYNYKGQYVGDFMPKIIDEQTFYRAQELIKKRKKAPVNIPERESYLLSGKIYCENCGKLYIGYSGRSKSKNKLHKYYACSGYKAHKCKCKPMRKQELEILVINEVMKLLTDKRIRSIAKEVAKISAEDPYSNKYKNLKKEEEVLKKKIKNLLSAVEDGIATKIVYEQLSTREQELEVLQRRIKEAKLLDTAITEVDVISFLNAFKNGNVENASLNKMVCDMLIYQVLVSDLADNKKEITIVCNAHNHNLNSLDYSTCTSSSPNYKYGGDEGSRTPVQE